MLHYEFVISCGSSKTIGIMVTLSFSGCFCCLGGLCCILSVLFSSPIQYMNHPIMNMTMSIGRSIIVMALLRLRLPFEVANFAPDYYCVTCKINFDDSE